MEGEDEIPTKIPESVKMAGYLEKKGKMVMKLMAPWKRYWFVLEDRLLLYYKSQYDYINLSPCRGSLNMGLASTVHLGCIRGHYIINVVTRTQVVQLRAKEKKMQEEWLQALVDSISLPVISAPVNLNFLRCSMDQLPRSENSDSDEEWSRKQRTLPYTSHEKRSVLRAESIKERLRGFSFNRHGGSLDTVVKVRRMKPASPRIPRGKTIDRILGHVEEDDGESESGEEDLVVNNVEQIVQVHRESSPGDMEEQIHDENQNEQDFKIKSEAGESEEVKIIEETRSDTSEEENVPTLPPRYDNQSDVSAKTKNHTLGKIKNVIKGIKTKEKVEIEEEKENKRRSLKKRKPSFLKKVFQKSYYKKVEVVENKTTDGYESEPDDPLYDTIKPNEEETTTEIVVEEPEYAAPCKEIKVFGTKSILTDQTMSELKEKLKSRESLEKEEVEEVKVEVVDDEKKENPPELPPRGLSRPRSPWHDVPRSVTVEEEENEDKQLEREIDNDLTKLLNQLTYLAQAPLLQPGFNTSLQETKSVPSEELFVMRERRLSEPDYDIPRPHNLLLTTIEQDKCVDVIRATEFLTSTENDQISRPCSIEPDSLETTD